MVAEEKTKTSNHICSTAGYNRTPDVTFGNLVFTTRSGYLIFTTRIFGMDITTGERRVNTQTENSPAVSRWLIWQVLAAPLRSNWTHSGKAYWSLSFCLPAFEPSLVFQRLFSLSKTTAAKLSDSQSHGQAWAHEACCKHTDKSLAHLVIHAIFERRTHCLTRHK